MENQNVDLITTKVKRETEKGSLVLLSMNIRTLCRAKFPPFTSIVISLGTSRKILKSCTKEHH